MHVFKKVEMWVVYLLLLTFFIAMIGFGALVRHEIKSYKSKFPLLGRVALFIAEIPKNAKNALFKPASYELLAIPGKRPNIFGFQGEPLKEETYLLLARYDGNIEQAVVELVDLRSFAIKKRWNPDFDQMNALVDASLPEFNNKKFDLERDRNDKRGRPRHPFLTKDGGLIFVDDGPLRKINKNSQLVWQNQEDAFHHSVEQDHEGNFWVPSWIYPYSLDEKYVGSEIGNFDDDAITKISPDGKTLFRKSVSKIFIEHNMEILVFRKNFIIDGKMQSDPIHLNDIQPVLTDSEYWKRGDLFLSLCNQTMIILYRPSTNKIIWKSQVFGGHFINQHDVDIIDDHRISIFNNNFKFNFKEHAWLVDGHNEVVIYDFETNSYSKYLNESLKDSKPRTHSQGSSEILDNGDLFIEETTGGRTLYYNKDGSLQWQHINRADNGNVFTVNWSRILYKPAEIKKVQHILSTSKN